MANGKTPYDEDYKSPYKNNTLRGMIGNAADYVGGVVSHDIEQMKEEAQQQKVYDEALAAEVKDWINNDLNEAKQYAEAAGNFLLGSPEETQTGNKMPTRTGDLLRQVRWDMHGKTKPTGQTGATEQPTQTGTTSGTTGDTVTYGGKVGGSTGGSTGGNKGGSKGTSSQTTTPLNFATKEDVVYYLASNTPGRNNLTEEQRVAMVENLWNQSSQGATTSGDQTSNSLPSDYSDTVTQNMQSDLLNTSNDTLYGKISGQSGNASNGVVANQDANSGFAIAQQARIANVQKVLGENPYSLATSIAGGYNPYSEQTMEDLRVYAPEYWNQLQSYIKKIQAGDNANAIASGGDIKTSADTTNVNNLTVDYAVNNSTSSVSSTQLLKSIDEKLAMNNDASSSIQIMDNIATEMEKQKNRLKNLKTEANNVFKGDASQAIVNAYINNKAQEIQNNLSILEGRWNSAYDVYKTAVSHAEWAADHELKEKSLQLDYYKELNGATGGTTNTNYTVAERNNNPLNMTVDFMKIMGAELGVDYEIGQDSFVNSNGGRQYYAKLIGDPVETTIRILDRAVANGMNPFTKTSWSYIEAIGMNKNKWNSMSYEEKAKYISDVWLPREGGSMSNMAYYVNQKGGGKYNPASAKLYDKYLSGDYGEGWLEKTAKAEGQTTVEFANSAKAYKADLDAGLFNPGGEDGGVLSQTAYDLLGLFAELYNETSNDKGELDFWISGLGVTYPYDKWNQIKSEMTLEKMIDARSNEIGFGQVTEGEWKMLREASTALGSAFWTRDSKINKEVNSLLSALRHAAYGKNNDISAEKWAEFRKGITERTNWNSSLEDQMKDAASMGLNGWQGDNGVITTPSDGNYVNAYGIID